MKSVLRNELIFRITFVWPLSIPLALLITLVVSREGGRRSRLVVWGGPIGALVALVRLARACAHGVAGRAPNRVVSPVAAAPCSTGWRGCSPR